MAKYVIETKESAAPQGAFLGSRSRQATSWLRRQAQAEYSAWYRPPAAVS